MIDTSHLNTSLEDAEEGPVDSFSWVLALFGTAIGAGILFLPIQVGISGFWVLLLVYIFIYPTIYFGHILYSLIPSRVVGGADFFAALNHWLPSWCAIVLHLLFIGWLFILLIAYSIALTNDFGEFLNDQKWLTINFLNRAGLSFVILSPMIMFLRFARPLLVRALGGLSLILIALLFLVSIAMAPHWNWSVTRDALIVPIPSEFLKQVLLLFPLLTLSFMFFPILSSLVRDLQHRIPNAHRRQVRLHGIVNTATLVICIFVFFFAISFMLTIPKSEFENAAQKNISALGLLGNLYADSWLGYLGPAISTIALLTSFLGIFIGYRESLLSLIIREEKVEKENLNFARAENWLHGLTFVTLWMLAIANVPVMDILGDLVAPLGAIFLLIVPAGIVLLFADFQSERKAVVRFVFGSGILVLFAYFVGSAI